jgi:hypothetical protein
MKRKMKMGRLQETICILIKREKFRVSCCNPFSKKQESLGRFDNEDEAHKAWRDKDHDHALALADLQPDERIAKPLRAHFHRVDIRTMKMKTFEDKVRQFSYDKHMAQMFSGEYFNICNLDSVFKARDENMPFKNADYKSLQLLHCVQWKDIPDSIREEMPFIITRLLKPHFVEQKVVKPGACAYLVRLEVGE